MINLLSTLLQKDYLDKRLTLLVLTISGLTTLGLALADINRSTMFLFSLILAIGILLTLRGWVRLTGIITPLISFFLLSYLIFQNYGLRDTAVVALPAVIIAASLLNGRWGTVVFGLLSLGMILVLGITESVGLLTNPLSWANRLEDYSVISFVIILIVVLQLTVLGRLNQSLQLARMELTERVQTEKQLEQRAEELELLYRTGLALSSGQNLYQALRAFVTELRHLMIADVFYIVYYDEQTDMISFPLYLTYHDELHFSSRKLQDKPGLTGVIIQTRKTLTLPDMTNPETQQRYQVINMVNMEIRSYVGIPLLIDKRIIGVLSIQAREPFAYTETQIRMVETLATQVAIVVEKSRLFEQLQQELVERKRVEAEVRLLNIELEERVRVRTLQLEAVNKELETFSYSVSHDLRAPLRGIDGFSFILEQEYASKLDATGQHYLARIRESTHRMNQLVNDLLAFSRLGRQEIHKLLVPLLPLLQEVVSDLQPEIAERQVKVTLANDLPSCEADPGLLRQVFANLLGNALKYSRTRKETQVEVNWKEADGTIIYYVKDNGVGFDMQFADKLFNVFQRLHRADEFEGTGVGLATVSRIITRHGGRIWAEAEVNKGATFYFTLTDMPPK